MSEGTFRINGNVPHQSAFPAPREFAYDVTGTLRATVIEGEQKPVFFIEEKHGLGWQCIRRIDGPKAYRDMGQELAKLSTENVGRIRLTHGVGALPAICRHYRPGHPARIS